MKNTYSILLIAALALNLVIPSHIAAAEPTTSQAEQVIVDVFKQHTNDYIRLLALKKVERKLIQKQVAHRAADDVSIEPISKAITLLEGKLQEERAKQEKIETKDILALGGIYLLTICIFSRLGSDHN